MRLWHKHRDDTVSHPLLRWWVGQPFQNVAVVGAGAPPPTPGGPLPNTYLTYDAAGTREHLDPGTARIIRPPRHGRKLDPDT